MRAVHGASRVMARLAAVAVVSMMLLTCADVLLRLLRCPIPGTYELVGFLGAIAVSFALAQTSLERGHIAVDFLAQRLSSGWQAAINGTNAAVGAILFGLLAWECVRHAADLHAAGEVSMTLQVPIYPIVYGIAAGCALLSLVLALRFLSILIARVPAS